jgi:methionyl-tRNA formyltransferase
MKPLRLAFMGTPAFAAETLGALLAAGHDVVCVYCQPPRPAGRGKRPRPSPVQELAEARGLRLRMPVSLKSAEEADAFRALNLDAAVVVAYGLILPKAILEAPRFGCLNLHASLLPRWRGAAPVQRAILAGDEETGVSIMRMDEGLDTGPVLATRKVPITGATTAGSLHDELAAAGAPLVVETLEKLAVGAVDPVPQPEDGASYASKIDKGEARIDWSRPAAEIERLIRGLHPHPGAFFTCLGSRIKVHCAEVIARESGRDPGTVLDDELSIACGQGVLRLTRLQREGRAPMTASEFLRGFPLEPGLVLG